MSKTKTIDKKVKMVKKKEINTENIILATDSYKLGHWQQYPKGTETVYSYFETRNGAEYPETVFFGLQYIIERYLTGCVVTKADIDEAETLAKAHFGTSELFNRAGWEHIVNEHGGHLPLRIRAVPEGTPVPTGNVMMTVENIDPECYWLTNAVESLLTHVWYPSTVATRSRETKKMIRGYLNETADTLAGLSYMLHDFGYRGVSSHESAGIGGAAHLLSFVGTDTLPAMLCAQKYYQADLATLAYSVPATEHSVMTSLGSDGEIEILDDLLVSYPSGILSVVSDSFDIYRFVRQVGARASRIKQREGVFVVRPDSCTPKHTTPEALSLWIAKTLDLTFGSAVNTKGYIVLDPHVRILWGDGIDLEGIKKILQTLKDNGYSAENMIFGMGGGLLQKMNRDTQRFAFKASAQERDGEWFPIKKNPLGSNKDSKAGRLKLIRDGSGQYATIDAAWHDKDLLVTVFDHGELMTRYTFDQIRENAAL